MKSVLTLLLLVFSAKLCFAQPFSEMEKRVKEAEDARDVNALLQLAVKSPAAKKAVLAALASVQSPVAVEFIFEALASKKADIRSAAAFALGQTLRDVAKTEPFEDKFFAFIEREKDPAVRAALLDALGRFGKMDALAKVAMLSVDGRQVRSAQALAIARFAIRGIKSPLATAKAAERYTDCRNPRGLNEALYALMRIGDSALIAPFDTIAKNAVRSANPNERMHAVAILGRIHHRELFHAVLFSMRDNDWRVSVNAIRASAAFRLSETKMTDSLQEAYAALLHRGSYQQIKTVLQTIAGVKFNFPKLVPVIRRLQEKSPSPDIQEEAMLTLSRFSPVTAGVLLDEAVKAKTVSPARLRAAAALIQLSTNDYARFLPLIRTHLRDDDPNVAAAALEAWRDLWKLPKTRRDRTLDTIRFENEMLVSLEYHRSKEHQHPGLVETIIETLLDSAFFKEDYIYAFVPTLHSFSSCNNVEAVGTLLEAIGKFRDPKAIEALRPYLADSTASIRKKAATILRSLGVADAKEVVFPAAPFEQWKILHRYKKNPIILIKTSKGAIRAELFVRDAPFTVESFIRLAEQGFYDGLTFHRVVPNFVVQGGDPLGDGTGGPPWTIRSEFSTLSFERGMLGIASSGKDTEGSQFFIMHSHHPHLDGRYTIFGKVKTGMDAADALEIGDRIISIIVEKQAKR